MQRCWACLENILGMSWPSLLVLNLRGLTPFVCCKAAINHPEMPVVINVFTFFYCLNAKLSSRGGPVNGNPVSIKPNSLPSQHQSTVSLCSLQCKVSGVPSAGPTQNLVRPSTDRITAINANRGSGNEVRSPRRQVDSSSGKLLRLPPSSGWCP